MQPSVTSNLVAKIVLKLLSVSVRSVLFLTIIVITSGNINSKANSRILEFQDSAGYNNSGENNKFIADTTFNDTLYYYNIADSLLINDTVVVDSLSSDSLSVKKTQSSPLKDKVTYSAKDSMRVDVVYQKLYLYGDAQVNYQDIELKAYYIILDMAHEEVYARGWPDSLGNEMGKPDFTKGPQNFQSDSMRYNFKTESGIIYHIVTHEGEGYLHSDKTKRHPNQHIHLEDGKYTTCDAEHPHFYLALTKGIVIPEDKIISGPAYLVIEDIPIRFFGVPFGFFPNTTNRASGVLIPTYGEEQTRGFYLRDFGWYQVLGDYADMRIQGDAYTKGSWAVRNTLAYKWRYHFSGSFAFNYAYTDDIDNLDYEARKDYAVRWNHRQDPKANPTQNFSASVNFTSREFDKNYSYSSSAYLNSTTNSSINYTKRWPNTPFNLSLSANASQNKQTQTVNMSLPTGSFNMSSIYPLRNKNGTGQYKWYENISLNYSSSFKNELSTYDDVLFEKETWDSLKNGFQHSVPLAVNFKIGKLITITPSVNYNGVLFTRHIEIDRIVEYDSVSGDYIENVTEYEGLKYEDAINPTIGVSFTPKLYGMFVSTSEDSYVEAFRHVLSPSASFSFTPDMNEFNNVKYYDTLYYYTNEERSDSDVYRVYNWYENEKDLFNPPSSNGKSGSIRLSLNNNLEMKVRPKNDTTGESKKVVLLDRLNFATSYRPFEETFRWSDVTMSTGTQLFNNKLSVNANANFNPYDVDSVGRKINEYYIKHNKGKPLRFVSLSVNTSFSLRSGQGNNEENEEAENEYQDENMYNNDYLEDDLNYVPGQSMGTYVNYKIPWSLNVQHSFSITKTYTGDPNISHTVNFSGDISLTPKWKIGGQVNYDIEMRQVSFTSIRIHRDLHCWEMHFSVVPFGTRASYSFTIQAKGSLLRDLKYEKKPNWYDKF